jgi:hypothetical protein
MVCLLVYSHLFTTQHGSRHCLLYFAILPFPIGNTANQAGGEYLDSLQADEFPAEILAFFRVIFAGRINLQTCLKIALILFSRHPKTCLAPGFPSSSSENIASSLSIPGRTLFTSTTVILLPFWLFAYISRIGSLSKVAK